MNQQLTWYYKDRNNRNYGLNSSNLNQSHFDDLEGVYIVFYYENRYIYTVYAGQGIIKDRFYAHRNDDRIQEYASKTLYITWAKASEDDQDGIEAYLHEQLNPLVRDRTPTATPIIVNLPWN